MTVAVIMVVGAIMAVATVVVGVIMVVEVVDSMAEVAVEEVDLMVEVAVGAADLVEEMEGVVASSSMLTLCSRQFCLKPVSYPAPFIFPTQPFQAIEFV